MTSPQNSADEDALLAKFAPLVDALSSWAPLGQMLKNEPWQFHRNLLKGTVREGLLQLATVSDAKLAEHSVSAAWRRIHDTETQKVDLTQRDSWTKFLRAAVAANADLMGDIARTCGPFTHEERKGLRKAAKRGRPQRANALAEPMLLYWLQLGLWMCDDATGATLLGGVLGWEPTRHAFAHKRRELRLYRRKQTAFWIVNCQRAKGSTLTISAQFKAELSELGCDARQVVRILTVIAGLEQAE